MAGAQREEIELRVTQAMLASLHGPSQRTASAACAPSTGLPRPSGAGNGVLGLAAFEDSEQGRGDDPRAAADAEHTAGELALAHQGVALGPGEPERLGCSATLPVPLQVARMWAGPYWASWIALCCVCMAAGSVLLATNFGGGNIPGLRGVLFWHRGRAGGVVGLRLFNVTSGVTEVVPRLAQVEADVQGLVEAHMEAMLEL